MTEQSIASQEIHPQPAPEFDAGVFTINYFATNPEGFTVRTDQSLHRRDYPNNGLPLSQDQRNDLRKGMGNEVFFTLPRDFPADKKPFVKSYFENVDELANKSAALLESGLDRMSDEYKAQMLPLLARRHELQAQLTVKEADGIEISLFKKFKLTDQLGLKAGIRNIRKEANELVIDTRPVSYPLYPVGAGSEESAETLDLSAVTGTAAILVTADNKIILQHRSAKNSPYGNMPGASIAGMLDGELAEKNDPLTGKVTKDVGTLKPINTELVKSSSETESIQEIGLTPQDFSEYRIVGEARDHIREHDEFLLLAKTELTAQEVAQKAADAPRSRNPKKLDEHGDFHFEENFITIDATPEAIATLLTEVRCPLPPTHAAAFVAAGYNIILEQRGIDAANAWRDQMQVGIRKNYEEINRMVTEYYIQNPSELNKNNPGKPPRNPIGYEPYYTPQEQGLPPLGPELIRTGLIR